MSNHGSTEELDQSQHQDQLEKEELLREILQELKKRIHIYPSNVVEIQLTMADIDFVACACGLSDYRQTKPKEAFNGTNSQKT